MSSSPTHSYPTTNDIDRGSNKACSSPSAIAFEDDIDSGPEKCGFVCHVLMVLFAVTYTAWISSFYYENATANKQQQQQAPVWTIVFRTAVVCLFFAAPVLYGALNAMAAAPHSFDSLCTIQDKHSAETSSNDDKSFAGHLLCQNNENGEIPEICDLDVAAINDLVSGTALLAT